MTPNPAPGTSANPARGTRRQAPDTVHEIVWWDPSILILDAQATEGVRHPDLIVKDVAEHVVEAGLADYRAWRARRDDAIARGAQPSLVVRSVRDQVGRVRLQPDHTGRRAPDVSLVEVAREPDRPSGPRFGTLVHAVLATVPLDAASDRIREVAALQGRVLGADDEEVSAAAEVADRVLAHELLGRARAAAARHACRREAPVMMKDADGTLIEGVVDLAFEDEGAWTVVDFKTDQELEAELDLYRRQVGLYAEMIAAATGRPARAVLMKI